MATLTTELIRLRCIPCRRITTRRRGCTLSDLSLSPSGNMAVSGKKVNEETFVDLYCSLDSDSNHLPTLFHSEDFQRNPQSKHRYCSFLTAGTDKIVTCIGDKTDIIDIEKNSIVLHTCKMDGKAEALSVNNGEIFIYVRNPERVLIFNSVLRGKEIVKLGGLKKNDSIWDMGILKDQVLVCVDHRIIVCGTKTGFKQKEYKNPKKWNSSSDSVTLSSELGLVGVCWDFDRIFFYPADGTDLMVHFKSDDVCKKIRLFEKQRLLVMGCTVCDIIIYNLAELFTYDLMKKMLQSILKKDDCERLANICGVSPGKSNYLFNQKPAIKNFLLACEEKGVMQPSDVTKIAEALLRIRHPCNQAVQIYQKIRQEFKQGTDETALPGRAVKNTDVSTDGRHGVEYQPQNVSTSSNIVQQRGTQVASPSALGRNLQQVTPERLNKMSFWMDSCIQDIHPKITREWRDVGRNLRLSNEVLYHIEQSHNGDSREMNHMMLYKWKQLYGVHATFALLADALSKSEREDLAQEVRNWETNMLQS